MAAPILLFGKKALILGVKYGPTVVSAVKEYGPAAIAAYKAHGLKKPIEMARHIYKNGGNSPPASGASESAAPPEPIARKQPKPKRVKSPSPQP